MVTAADVSDGDAVVVSMATVTTGDVACDAAPVAAAAVGSLAWKAMIISQLLSPVIRDKYENGWRLRACRASTIIYINNSKKTSTNLRQRASRTATTSRPPPPPSLPPTLTPRVSDLGEKLQLSTEAV